MVISKVKVVARRVIEVMVTWGVYPGACQGERVGTVEAGSVCVSCSVSCMSFALPVVSHGPGDKHHTV